MSMIRFVTPDGLPAFLAYLSQNGRRVLVPVEKPANKRSVVFEPWQEGKPFTLEKATVPAKEAVLPQCETLVRYKKTKAPENLERVTMSLDDKPEAQPTVVFACRPCDARGYAVLDPTSRVPTPILTTRRGATSSRWLRSPAAAAAIPASATGLAAAQPPPKARTCL